ncbi:MAG: hypothetical protein R6V60_12640, partial [Desulfobacterales bacterium]
SSWVISPIAGGLIAAVLLYVLERAVLWKQDPIAAAIRYIPLMLEFARHQFLSAFFDGRSFLAPARRPVVAGR